MRTVEGYDVVVVGAGPAGSLAARAAAESGASTLVVDRRTELGEPVQCGEFLPTPGELADIFHAPSLIEQAFQIPAETVLRETHWMACIAPSGRRFRFPLSGYMVSRRAFDKALAYAAEGAGAELRYPAGVSRVHGDRVEMVNGTTIRAKVVIGADGPTSTVARSAGFAPKREMFRMITATVDGGDSDEIDLYFGHSAPGGYAWSFPRSTDANVGLGVTELPPGTTLSSLLDRFLERERLGVARDRTRWWVPIGPPPETLVFGRTLFCGDAANLVMATNGGGIPTAMLSGWLAGTVAGRHAREGVPLTDYDHAWRSVLAPPLARGHRIKETTDRIVRSDLALTLGMRYIGASGLDSVMRLRWPRRLGRAS